LKKKMVLVPILALLLLFIVAPAMATPATKVPVTITTASTGMTFGYWWVTDGGVVQMRDFASDGKAYLQLASSPSTVYTLTTHREFFTTVIIGNDIPFPGPWPDAKGITHSNVVWTYSVDGQVQGTFKGVWTLKFTGWTIVDPAKFIVTNGPSQGHAVLQGDGVFAGQTLMLDSTGPPTVFTGYLLIV
jgi:hypothetical protein